MSEDKRDDYKELAWICRSWWRRLNALDRDGKSILIGDAEKSRDRAALAELRRIDVTNGHGTASEEVVSARAFYDLFLRLREAAQEKKLSNRRLLRWLSEDNPELAPFAIAAATLARVREDCGKREAKRGETAWLLAAPRSEGADKNSPLFAEVRFKRLIRTRDDWPGLMSRARRIAAILEREAPIGDLGASLILWNADPRIASDWALQYYGREFEPAEPRDESAASTNT